MGDGFLFTWPAKWPKGKEEGGIYIGFVFFRAGFGRGE